MTWAGERGTRQNNSAGGQGASPEPARTLLGESPAGVRFFSEMNRILLCRAS